MLFKKYEFFKELIYLQAQPMGMGNRVVMTWGGVSGLGGAGKGGKWEVLSTKCI